MNGAAAWLRSRPLLDAGALALAAVVLARYGPGAGGLIAAFATLVLIGLSAVDLEQRRLPNAVVLPAAAVVLAARLASQPAHWRLWLAATLLPALAFLILALVYPAGLGMGDVKLTLLVGSTLGGSVLVGLLLGSLAAAAAGVLLLLREGASARRRTLPLGPFLASGAILALLLLAPGR